MNKTKILSTEYGAFNEDVRDFFKARLSERGQSVILDPMAGTAPLIPFIEHNGHTAYFNDLMPLHYFINKAKIFEVYENYEDNGAEWYIQKLHRCMGSLEDKVSIISDKWIDDSILKGLMQAWKMVEIYDECSATLLKAIILLCVRPYSSITKSKNPTWIKVGGISSNKDIQDIIQDSLKIFQKYYQHNYGSSKIKDKGECNFFKVDATALKLPQMVDLILTSPWYCNRLDPANMYGPENYFLSALGLTFSEYSQVSTPKVRYYEGLEQDYEYLASRSKYADRFLTKIKKSSIPDDPSYYFKYYTQYFAMLWKVMEKITNHLLPHGEMYVVLQDNIHRGELIEIDTILHELYKAIGWKSEVVLKWERHHLGLRNVSRKHAFVKPRHFEKMVLVTR